MSDEALKIKIGVETKEFVKGWDELQAKLKGLPKSTNSAALALTNLGRVAQDAPFGFIAIQNNLNPLLESFQRLKQESGSTGGALKALASSLTGAGGIGLALSIGTALFVTFGDTITKWASKIDEATQRQTEFKAAMDGAVAATQGEVVQVQSLVAIAGNEALSREARTEALKKLQAEYPSYFANVKFDGKLTENLAVATNKLTQAIVLNAKAKAIQKQIDESAERAATASTDPTSTITGLEAFGQALLDNVLLRTKEATAITLADRAIARSGKIVNQEATFQNKLAAELLKVNEALAAQGSLFDDKPIKPKAQKVKVDVEEITLHPAKVAMDNLVFNDGVWSNLVNGIPKLKPEIDTQMALLGRNLNVPLKVVANTKEAEDKLKRFNEAMISASESAASTLAEGFGEVLGQALTGGNPLAAGLELIADTLVQLGKAAVGAGIAMLSLKQLFKNPATAIVAGVAAIALGAAIKSSIPKFAQGGIATGPTVGMFGEAGKEAIIPLKQLPGLIAQMQPAGTSGFVATTRISGNDLLLSVQRTQNQYGSTSRL